ncbi:MAG: 50S ribosomal protein L6 [Treponema sp.]|nr:50S ribosomal protein L6 [Treponema sp.]
MSKLGKLPVALPAGVTATVAESVITVKGPKGELSQRYNSTTIEVKIENDAVTVKPIVASKQANADHGLYRSLINNMVTGVSAGFSKSLIITGVGYRAEVKGNELVMNLGYSNDFIALIPDGLTVTADANGKVTVSGNDKQRVGQFCAEIRSLRKPEPYKGKGIRYETEVIRRKVGKTGVK